MNFSDAPKANGHGPEPSTAIVPHQTASIAIPDDQSVGQALARAERQIQFRKGIVKLIAANIDQRDIQLFGSGDSENLWLSKNACKQILSWAGARVEPDSVIQEKQYDGVDGKYIDFEVWATILTPDSRAVRTMGNRSTYDDFYAKKTRYTCPQCKALTEFERGCPEHGKVRSVKEEYYLPLSEVDIPAIKQAAITNMWNHAVQDMGLMPTLDDLKAAGLDLKAQKRVEFKGNKQNSTQAPAGVMPPKAASSPQPATRAAGTTSPSTASAAPPSANGSPSNYLPKASVSGMPPSKKLEVGKGIISDAFRAETKPSAKNTAGGTPYVKVVQNGDFLFCYHNKMIETMDGPFNILDLIVDSKGQFCDFVIQTKPGKNGPLHTIEGALRIGRYAWDENKQPIPLSQPAEGEDRPW